MKLTGDVGLFEDLLILLVDLLRVVDGVRVDLLADALHGALGRVRDVWLALTLQRKIWEMSIVKGACLVTEVSS